jgi:transcriptional regulator with XRE-family HTH domain
MKLNEKIAFYRRKLGYSQQTLADAMSVSRQSVSKWETGESLPEVTKLPQLAALFGVTTDFLLSEDAPAEDSAPPQPEKSAEVEDFAPERHTESGGSTADFVRAVPDAVDAIADRLPHFLGKLVRLYGWVAGLRIAVAGVMAIVFAVLCVVLSSSFDQTLADMNGFGSPEVKYYNADGTEMKNVPKALRDYIEGSDTASSGWSIDTSDMSAPFMPFFLIIGGIGVVLLIGGLALAFYLKPHFPAH